MKKLAVIEAPICAGSPSDGSQYAYQTLKPIIQQIFGEQAAFFDRAPSEKKGLPQRDHLRSLDEVVDVSRRVWRDVTSALAGGMLPLIIGGDHSVAMGSIAGAAEHFGADALSVVYIDGHTDIHTDQTTETGCIHGMPLAQAMGLCRDDLNIGKEKVHLHGENLSIIGARSIDEGEYPIIRSNGVHLISAEDAKARGMDAVMHDVLAQIKTPCIHISFDVDCMDGEVFPATGYRIPKGLTKQEAFLAVEQTLATGKVVSMDLVEYNPRMDRDGRCMEILYELLSMLKDYQSR